MRRSFLFTGSLLMAIAVAFGAFGAHIMQDMLTPERYEIYQTAVEYHIYHALGLLIAGIVSGQLPDSQWLLWSGRCLIAGILVFSGSLYLLVLTDTGWLGAVTPLGGLAFIGAWILFAAAIFKKERG
ncbi:MAG: DUF423 domain-containing protein [Balneolaceae bacterium]